MAILRRGNNYWIDFYFEGKRKRKKIGPNYRGLYGSKVPLEGGQSVTADEEYLRESIVEPGAKVVKGYPNVMPTYKTSMPPDDVRAAVEYLKTLK